MKRLIILTVIFASFIKVCQAQVNTLAAYEEFVKVTVMLRGNQPYYCHAIVDVSYKSNKANTHPDTSMLTYRNGMTYYKSGLVEHVEGKEGELIINHELKTVSFSISDSINRLIQKELGITYNKEVESLLDSNGMQKETDEFKRYVLERCDVSRTDLTGLTEIQFKAKDKKNALLLSVRIQFDTDGKLRYYEYVNKEMYATDWEGNGKYRVVTTIYDNFRYENVPQIPVRLSDYLEWNGWNVKLKKYTNYKFSLL